MSTTIQVLLVPGFFGFQALAGLPYFFGVRELLRDALGELGVPARVHALDTLPTASLESRALHLGERIADRVGSDGSAIHLVGHSTGGLDARVLLSPDAGHPELGAIRSRVRSLVSVATPHYGTPLADYMQLLEGQKFLRLFALLSVYGLRVAGPPLANALNLGRLLTRMDDLRSLRESALDTVYELLADPLGSERVRPIEAFLAAVRRDQSLVRQLGPRAMAGFEHRFRRNPQVHYADVLTRARPPRLLGPVEVGLDPIGQLTHAIYQGLYRLTATFDGSALPALTHEQVAFLERVYGKVPDTSANDGLVPTRSQVCDRVIHVARADHHDVIGYFGAPEHDPPHLDWVATGCGFRRSDFEQLWRAVAAWIARAQSA